MIRDLSGISGQAIICGLVVAMCPIPQTIWPADTKLA